MIESNDFYNNALINDYKSNYQKAFDNYLRSISSKEVNEDQSRLNVLGILVSYVFDNGATYDMLNVSLEPASVMLYNLGKHSTLVSDNIELKFLYFYISNYYSNFSEENNCESDLLKLIAQDPSCPFGYVIHETCYPGFPLKNKDKKVEEFILTTEKKLTCLNEYFRSIVE